MRYKPLIKFIIVCFIIYAVYQGNAKIFGKWFKTTTDTASSIARDHKYQEKSKNHSLENSKANIEFASKSEDSMISNFTVNVLNKILDNPHGRLIFEEIVNKTVQQQYGVFGDDITHKTYIAKDLELGKGATAQCGAKVEILYNITNSENIEIQTQTTPIKAKQTLVIGSDTVNKSLENGIIGMKIGGTRKIIFADKKTEVSDKKNKNYQVSEVTLLEVKDSPSQSSNNITDFAFIKKEDYPGQIFGAKIMCGDKISTHYKIFNLSGKLLYDSKYHEKKITFVIGDKKTPISISSGLIGLAKNKTSIVLIAKPDNVNYTDHNSYQLIPKQVKIPKDEMVILEINTSIL